MTQAGPQMLLGPNAGACMRRDPRRPPSHSTGARAPQGPAQQVLLYVHLSCPFLLRPQTPASPHHKDISSKRLPVTKAGSLGEAVATLTFSSRRHPCRGPGPTTRACSRGSLFISWTSGLS